MAKFPRLPKLNHRQIEDIVIDLCEAMATTRNSQEAAKILTDLLGKQELEMLAKRLKVAELLLEGWTYEDITKAWKVSPGTIARVQTWLQQSGEGYRLAIDRAKPKRESREKNEAPMRLRGIKKKYPMYFWPQIVLEYWIKNSSQKQKQEMQKILEKLNDKPKMYQQLENLLSVN
jgi:TrpR-related protein YerC/YecD